MNHYYPTRHAVSAMTARNISWEEVLWVLEAPEVCYRNTSHGPHAGRNSEIRQRGSLYVVVALSPTFDSRDTDKTLPLYAVITAGLRRTQVWTNEDARRRDDGQDTPDISAQPTQ